MKNKSNTRREAIQQLGLLTAGMLVLPLSSCNDNKSAKENVYEIKAPLPFLIPSQAPLEPGSMGSNMRTLIRSAQTNKQFSCIEAILAPKKLQEVLTSTIIWTN